MIYCYSQTNLFTQLLPMLVAACSATIIMVCMVLSTKVDGAAAQTLIEHVQGVPHSQLQGRRCVLVIYSVECVYCILRDCIVQKFYSIKLVRFFM